MHEATCCSRAVSLPSGPLGGRAVWQIGHSSSSRRTGAGAAVEVAAVAESGNGTSMSSIERYRGVEVWTVFIEAWAR